MTFVVSASLGRDEPRFLKIFDVGSIGLRAFSMIVGVVVVYYAFSAGEGGRVAVFMISAVAAPVLDSDVFTAQAALFLFLQLLLDCRTYAFASIIVWPAVADSLYSSIDR